MSCVLCILFAHSHTFIGCSSYPMRVCVAHSVLCHMSCVLRVVVARSHTFIGCAFTHTHCVLHTPWICVCLIRYYVICRVCCWLLLLIHTHSSGARHICVVQRVLHIRRVLQHSWLNVGVPSGRNEQHTHSDAEHTMKVPLVGGIHSVCVAPSVRWVLQHSWIHGWTCRSTSSVWHS